MIPQESLTVWVAFTLSDPNTGCIRCIPGTHLAQTDFINKPEKNNLLSRGQTTQKVDETKAVFMPLNSGQFSIHHERTVHGSEPNKSDDRRIGMSIHYTTPATRQTEWKGKNKPTATLLRGNDRYGHWTYEELTTVEYDANIAAEMVRVREGFLDRR